MEKVIRDKYFDVWKGIAILCVVLIHTSGPIAFHPEGIVLRQIINFAVSLFVALVGYFSYTGYVQSFKKERSFYVHRLLNLLVPYLVWTFICVILFKRGYLTSWWTFMYHVLLVGRGISIGYYVILLLQLILLTRFFVIERIISFRFGLIVLANLAMVGLTYCCVIDGFSWESIPVPVPMIFAPTFGIAYTLGLYFRKMEIEERNSEKNSFFRWSSWGIVVGLILSIVEGFFWRKEYPLLAIFELKISGLLMSIAVIVFCFSHRNRVRLPSWLEQSLAYIGRNSFLIYLVHMSFLGHFRVFSARILHVNVNSACFTVVSTGFILMGCLLLCRILKQWVPSPVLPYIGVSGEK